MTQTLITALRELQQAREVLATVASAWETQSGGKLYRHAKTGGIYLEYGRREGMAQEAGEEVYSGVMGAPLITVTDSVDGLEEIVLYRNIVTKEGFARPARLFDDGRFTRISPSTEAPSDPA